MPVHRQKRPLATILDGKATAAEIRGEVAREVRSLVDVGGRPPGLAAVIVGDDPASRVYVGNKAKACSQVGIASRTLELPAQISEAELTSTVEELNRDEAMDGILVQLPLPGSLSPRRVLERIAPHKDVDGFHPMSVGRLWLDEDGFVPATASGILELLRRSEIPLEGKHAVIVGRSAIVGKPLAALLLQHHCTVTVCHSRTRDLAGVCRTADLLVAAVGRPLFLGPDHVQEGAVVIDVGITRLTSADPVDTLLAHDEDRLEKLRRRGSVLVGDVDFARVSPIASAITPVPGGVGPLTVAMLLVNTVKAARRNQELE
jgi:methylenetetrahydrofolate dehydrogenase (NADP+)/methenyltetrahydrofolate cyclohydrolase